MQLLPEQLSLDLSEALGRSVRTPLEALRIILEDLSAGTTDCSALPSAIDTLRRVRRGVESIEDFFHAKKPQPLTCTVREIAHGVRDYLPEAIRSELLIALDADSGELVVDGPMLIKSLSQLATNSIEASKNPVLLRVQSEESGFTFSIVGHSQHDFRLQQASAPFQTDKHGHVGLGLTLATRDIERLGGKLVVKTGPSQATRFEVSFSSSQLSVEAA